MTYDEAVKLNFTPEQMAAAGIVVPTTSVKRPRITDVGYDVAFQLEDGDYDLEISDIRYKNAKVKGPDGKLLPIEEPKVGQTDMRAWLMLRAGDRIFCQEYAKANGAGFQTVLQDGDDTVLKTGAKLLAFNGKLTYHM